MFNPAVLRDRQPESGEFGVPQAAAHQWSSSSTSESELYHAPQVPSRADRSAGQVHRFLHGATDEMRFRAVPQQQPQQPQQQQQQQQRVPLQLSAQVPYSPPLPVAYEQVDAINDVGSVYDPNRYAQREAASFRFRERRPMGDNTQQNMPSASASATATATLQQRNTIPAPPAMPHLPPPPVGIY
jgi:hypothetical protein